MSAFRHSKWYWLTTAIHCFCRNLSEGEVNEMGKKSFKTFFNSIHVFIRILVYVYVRTSTSVEINSHLTAEGEICGGSSFCGCCFTILELPEVFWKVKFYLCWRKFGCAKAENCLHPFALHAILACLSLNNKVGSSRNIKCVCSDQYNVSNM